MDSPARRLGLALNVLLDVQPDSPYVNALFGELRKTRNREGHWGSTQTNGLAAAALGKWAGLHPEAARTRATVHTPDGDSDVTAKSPFRFAGPFAGEFRATADGPGPLYCSWTLAGVPVQAPIQEESNGMTIQRDYLTDSGAPVQTVGQGDLVRVRLRIATQAPRPNVVLVDLLPGGFEIEDAEMATRWAPPDSNRRLNVRFVEKREDRLLLFCDLGGHKTEPAEYTYTVRAVTRGRFNPTRVTAEAMYSPEVRAGLTPPVGVTVE